MRKVIFISIGIMCMVLGVIGVILPVMPGLIFFVIAGYFFSKSSPSLYKKLVNIPKVGDSIHDWQSYGVMDLKTKLGVISFFWSTVLSSILITQINYAYLLILINFALIFSLSIIAIDTKVR